jgi:predicted RNase H-like HicB family nuclease
MSKYEIRIFWSEVDQAYIAQVPELAGCMADGGTYGEALTNVERVAAEWLETARSLGRRVPVPKPRGALEVA